MVRRRRIRHAGAGSSTDAPRDRWPWLRPAYRERQTTRPFTGRGELLPFPPTFHHPAYRTIPCAPQLLITPVQKKKRLCITTRVIPPLAAAPATERSERVGEEAEESQMQALCTYAPVPVSACVLFIGCAVFTSVRLFTPDMVHFPSMSAPMQNEISQYTHRYRSVNWVRAAPRHPH